MYIASYDLLRLVLARVETWDAVHRELWGAPLVHAARDVAVEAMLALTFPKGRQDALIRVDEAIVRTRLGLRLAADRGLVSPGWHRLAQGQLATIGRMVGGWRKHARDPPEP